MIKRGSTPALRIEHENLNVKLIDDITYIFKSSISEHAPAILERTVNNTIVYDSTEQLDKMLKAGLNKANRGAFSLPVLLYFI